MGGNALPPEFLKMREEMMRFNALKDIKNKKDMNPRRDVKYIFITFGVIAAIIAGLFLIPYLAQTL